MFIKKTKKKTITSVSAIVRPVATPQRAARDGAGGKGKRAGEWQAMQPAGIGLEAGRRLGGEHETKKWKKSLIGKSLLREVGPIYSLVWHSTTTKELD